MCQIMSSANCFVCCKYGEQIMNSLADTFCPILHFNLSWIAISFTFTYLVSYINVIHKLRIINDIGRSV